MPSRPEPEMDGAERLQDPLLYERRFWSRGIYGIAGVDEVGRGPLAGPVVAAAVILPPDTWIEGAIDSKQLSAEERELLSAEILSQAHAVSLGAASVREIDRYNILRATTRAMRRALDRLQVPVDHVVVDGLPVKDLGYEHEAIVKGDSIVHSIACASIVAKVCRDRAMTLLDPRYPQYKWGRNMGYGSASHRAAIDEFGPTPHHRMSFGLTQLDLGL